MVKGISWTECLGPPEFMLNPDSECDGNRRGGVLGRCLGQEPSRMGLVPLQKEAPRGEPSSFWPHEDTAGRQL